MSLPDKTVEKFKPENYDTLLVVWKLTRIDCGL